MKRIISLIFLIISLLSITFFTIYTLMHKDIKKEIDNKIQKTIVKVSSNILENSLSEVYNIYLNNEKYKIKLDYNFIKDKDISSVELVLFMDGVEVFKDIVCKGKFKEFDNILNNKLIGTEELNFEIYNNEKDYLLFNLDYVNDSNFRKMYIFDDNGKEISNKEIVVYDENKSYKENEDFKLYKDFDREVMVKVQDNSIYILEEKKNKKNIIVEEYKCFIKDSKIEKELINTYEDIEIKEVK